MSKKTKIAIVDDHQLVLEGLHLMLNGRQHIKVCGLFKSINEVLQFMVNDQVDVILLDINMPEMNGIEGCKLIRKKNKDVKIIGLSMIGEINLIKLMLKNGANGYLHKNCDREEIEYAISQVMQDKLYLSDDIAQSILVDRHSENYPTSPFPKLSRREEEVLRLVVDEKTTQEIADKLFISFGTVETHRRNIMIKLGVKNTAGLVRVAFEYGLLGDD